MRFGAIYIAHNPRDGATIFKVGKTERGVDERMKELTASTSNLGAYTARAFFVVNDIDAAETACHKRLERYRVQNNREFFDLPLLRLLQMVQEEIAPYAARDFLPDLPSGVLTYHPLSTMVIPAYAGIQAVPRCWIPACAGMTFHRCIHGRGATFKMYNTL